MERLIGTYLFKTVHFIFFCVTYEFMSTSVSELSFPRFAEPIPNITVTIGRDALLGCVVDNLKNYKVILK